MEFEWDDSKAAANLAKHGVNFEYAARAFFDPRGLELPTTDSTTARSAASYWQ